MRPSIPPTHPTTHPFIHPPIPTSAFCPGVFTHTKRKPRRKATTQCEHLSFFSGTSIGAFLQKPTGYCSECGRRVYVCLRCYVVLNQGGSNGKHYSSCSGSAVQNRLRKQTLRDPKTKQFRSGRSNPRRAVRRSSNVLVLTETSLQHRIPPRSYKTSIVCGRTGGRGKGLMRNVQEFFDCLTPLIKLCSSSKCVVHRLAQSPTTHFYNVDPKRGKSRITMKGLKSYISENERAYITIEIDSMTSETLEYLLRIAPVPTNLKGFIYHRAYIFLSKMPQFESVCLCAHTDKGSGPLVYACGTLGSKVEIAMTNATCDKTVPLHMKDPFNETFDHQHKDLHFTTLHQRGDFFYVPSGYWHSVLSSGIRICVSYFDVTDDTE